MSLVLVARPVLGQAPAAGARLSYARGPGAEGCADEQALRDVVAAQLGGSDPFVDGGGRQVGSSEEFVGEPFGLRQATERLIERDLRVLIGPKSSS